MQSVEQEKVRPASLGDDRAQPVERGTAGTSWFSRAEANADVAARAGFVVSLIFLVMAALYALQLTGTTVAFVEEVRITADRAAYDAGFRVEDLVISGVKNTPREMVLKVLGLPYAESSLSYDAVAAKDRLLTVGWIASAEVRRVLPSRLEVRVAEYEPFARWMDGGNVIQAIDQEGRVLGPADGRFDKLLLFSGDGANLEAAEMSAALNGHDDLKRRIESLDFIAERYWQLRLDNGLIVKLPRKLTDFVLSRLETLLASNKIAELSLETIDLRLINRTILQLREPTLANRDKAVALITSGQPQPSRKGRAL